MFGLGPALADDDVPEDAHAAAENAAAIAMTEECLTGESGIGNR